MLILQLCEDIWIHISSYLDNIKYLLRLKLALNKKCTQFDMGNIPFWLNVTEQFYRGQTEDFSNYLERIAHSSLSPTNNASAMLRDLFSSKKCSRSGCLKVFTEICNNEGVCMFHPGRKKSSGKLSCCRERSFQSEGCKRGFHDGFLHKVVFCQRSVETENVPSLPLPIKMSSTESLPKIIENVSPQKSSINSRSHHLYKLPKI